MANQYLYSMYITNDYLGKSKTVKGVTESEVESKANIQIAKWNEEERLARERARRVRERADKQAAADRKKAEAEQLNHALSKELSAIKNLLENYSRINIWKEWAAKFYRYDEYPGFSFYDAPTMEQAISSIGGIPEKTFLELILRKKKRYRESQEQLSQKKYQEMLDAYANAKAKASAEYLAEKEAFYKKRDVENQQSYKIAKAQIKDEDDFSDFTSKALALLSDHIYGHPEMSASLSPDKKTILINISMRNTEEIPSIREYRYISARNEIVKFAMEPGDFNTLYDTYIFSTVAFIFASIGSIIYDKGIEIIVVNAWVSGIDRETGKDFTSCILSVQATEEDIADINFARVDPKQCIRGLKGLYAGGSLSSLTPIKPIVNNFDKNDPRFIESRDVLSELDPTQNLAMMDWQNFEHLIGQLFESIFAAESGGEVKVTRASRDSGVDAIAFDPDPIRGGKFVIQAKRYNNVVDASAVRDLYGTLMNEGAVKGILVTTSYFGKASYDFAKDKPIQLIDGRHLLWLLEQYGHGTYNITLPGKKST